jgi:hypothetical protein
LSYLDWRREHRACESSHERDERQHEAVLIQ